MIISITPETIAQIKNTGFRSYAATYLQIYQDFIEQVKSTGLEIETEDTQAETNDRLQRLRDQGAIFRNNGKSILLNAISPSCVACQKGIDSSTFFISLKCHRDCFYCFNGNQENYEFYLTHQRDVSQELADLHAAGHNLRHVALTGGEPLLFKEETIRFYETARQKFPAAHTRLYTSGDQADAQTLQSLGEAGLDEIRFSIRMHDLAKGQRHTFDRIALAKKYIPCVMVEMPVLPGTFDTMTEVLLELHRLDIFSVNLLEFCFPLINAQAYIERGYKVKRRPYRILYDYWYAGGLPVAGSELECLALLEFALEQKLTIGLHYCSLENKHTGQLYQQNANRSIPATHYFSGRDYFLKSAKVFGADMPGVIDVFKRIGYTQYAVNPQQTFVEFHIGQINRLKKLDIELGLATSTLETREDGQYLRELQVDLTYPRDFNLARDA